MERYPLEKAQDEAEKMKEKIVSGEAIDFSEAENLVEKNEAVSWFESAREFGNQHNAILGAVLGKIDFKYLSQTSFSDAKLQLFAEGVKLFVEEQQKKQASLRLDSKGMLSQVFMGEENQELLADDANYRHIELAPGIHAVFVSIELFDKLRPGTIAQASAIMPRDGISFMIIPEYEDDESNNITTRENIPHEAHHMIWKKIIQNTDAFNGTEKDPDIRFSFRTFQDELLARISGNGSLGGYGHLDKATWVRSDLDKRKPGVSKEIDMNITETNMILGEIDSSINKSAEVRKKDLIKAVMYATNYKEFKLKLREVESFIKKLPVRSTDDIAGGWQAV